MGITSALVQVGRSSFKEISKLKMRSSTGSDLQAAVSPSPWLMIQPSYDSKDENRMIHRFFRFEDKKEVVKLKAVGADAASYFYKIPNYVGSSHGWLASYNREKRTMFLSDPVQGLSADFPTLGDTPNSGEDVSRVVFSSSPDARALMIYGPHRRLAAGRGGRWSPIKDDVGMGRKRRVRYENVAYSSRRGTFFCIMRGEDGRHALESWDVSDADSPRIDWTLDPLPILEDPSYKGDECLNINYLVFNEEEEEQLYLYLVVRRALVRKLPCGSYNPSNIHYTEYRFWNRGHPHKTVDFVVYKIDIERKQVTHMINSLDGLALFVGINQPVAVRVSPNTSRLQPNSIYFTDLPEFAIHDYSSHDIGDNGIFNYESKTLSPFLHSYPIDVRSCCLRKLVSAPLPLWYTPTTM